MTNLAVTKSGPLLATKRTRPGRPQKPFDHAKLDALEVPGCESPAELLVQFFIFDARTLDRETQRELQRILPRLIHASRAWKAHFCEHGCPLCQTGRSPDPTTQIAANLRGAGTPWNQIFEAVTVDAELTPQDRKRIRTCASRILRRRVSGRQRRKPGKSSIPTLYGAGGFCQGCQQVILHRMLKRFRNATQGRDFDTETDALRDALSLRYNAAQRLLNGGDE